MRWTIILFIVAILIWMVVHHKSDNKGISSAPVSENVGPAQNSSTVLKNVISSKVAVGNSNRSIPPPVKPGLVLPSNNQTDKYLKNSESEAKQDIHFLNSQKDMDIKKLLAQSKPWGSLPMVNKFGISLTGSSCGNVRFKTRVTDGNWRVVLHSSYRDNGNSSQNFGSIAVLKDGVLKSFHTSDEPGYFQGDPTEPTHFIIKASKIMYIQLFNMETTADADVIYYYAGNIFIQNEIESHYSRLGIVLLEGGGCSDEDAGYEIGVGIAPMDDISPKLFQKAAIH